MQIVVKLSLPGNGDSIYRFWLADQYQPHVYMNTVANSIFIPDITTIEVINVILLLKNNCAGWDDIPAYVMKMCIHVYIVPLTHIIDKSIKEGVFSFRIKIG